MLFDPLLIWAVVLFTVTAALIDCFQRRIPNWLTVSTSLLAFTFYYLAAGWPGLLYSLQGFATGFGLLLTLWLVGGGGGGDVKLMAATGALFGAQLTLVIFIASVLLSLFGLAALTLARCFGRPADQSGAETEKKRRVIPYALPAAGAAWLVLAWQIVLR